MTRLTEIQRKIGPGRTGYFEGSKVAEILAIHAPSTKYIHNIVDEGSGVAFSREWNIPNTLKIAPRPGDCIKAPSVVIMVLTVRSTKPAEKHELARSRVSTITLTKKVYRCE
jgi:hypothetical protein